MVDAETRFLIALQRATTRPSTVVPARLLSLVGEHAGIWLLTAGAGAAFDRPSRRSAWLRAGAAVFAAHGVSVIVKRVARRVRPVHTDLVNHVAVPSRWSFPSSHATSTTAAAVVFRSLIHI